MCPLGVGVSVRVEGVTYVNRLMLEEFAGVGFADRVEYSIHAIDCSKCRASHHT